MSTPEDKAARGMMITVYYREINKESSALHFAMSNIITDLRHLAEEQNIDFSEVLDNAITKFDQEEFGIS